jgi:acetamidase/formamidase
VTTGATVHLPVYVPGALLHVGDMHAIQGDGEICGAGGIETEGVVRLSCSLAPKPGAMNYPRIENDTHIIATGIAKPAEDAFRLALENLILWMEESYSFERGEAFMLLAQVMEARCTQFVNPTFTYVAKIEKKYLG